MPSPLEKARKMMAWIEKNIEKRPVLSLPDALSTLENRIGDCNEHAVLFAAMARAAYIPAKVEAGVVYLNGRFFYHAWNLVDLGRSQWITADALFNQIPADVTHIRLTSGAQEDQLNIMGLIGKLGITLYPDCVLNYHRVGLVLREVSDLDAAIPTLAVWRTGDKSKSLNHFRGVLSDCLAQNQTD